ncbi:carnitine O-acetyltransferase-like isoform X3 [Cetorhinus maximus]
MLAILRRAVFRATLVKPGCLVRPIAPTKQPGRYLVHQKSLPRLPVPPLQQTLERYLLALEPIVSQEELENTKQIVKEFGQKGGVGERLQASLERRARKTENWLCDWWLRTAYLEYRLPVVIHSSPAVLLPKQDYYDRQGQLRFAAKLISGVLDFKTMIDNETLPVETLSGNPLCMNQYYQILSSCRIPGPKSDSVVNYSQTKKPTYITVVHNFQFFELFVYNSDGSPLTVDQIYMQLEKIWHSSLQTNKEPIGILTTGHRNSWANAYNNLIKDKVNKESVKCIQKSIFTICLDAPVPKVSDELYMSHVAAQMLHGGGSRWNSGNRWFDKTLQFIIGEDGSCGLIYEHSPSEGPPIVALLDHVFEYCNSSVMVRSPMIPLAMPRKLRFNITPDIKGDIEKAKQNLNMIYGEPCATYESASLRMFHLGRTDTIRSATVESSVFVRAMDNPEFQNQQKVALVRKAVQSHRTYTDTAIRGQAIDRHLLGLKLQAIEDLVRIPEIFMDTSYAVAFHFNLSTSQVPAKTDCLMCFGPTVPDGYGVCYNPMDAHINFAVSAFNSCAETNAAKLVHYLEQALVDMRGLLMQTPSSKL